MRSRARAFSMAAVAFLVIATGIAVAQDAGSDGTAIPAPAGTPSPASPAPVVPAAPTVPAAPAPSPTPLPSGPTKDFIPAIGLENWSYTYDLSGFQPGMYNILVRGVDSAGNIAFGGPFNIVIDPKSDLPVTAISNPLPYMRVGSDLNIVGTCIDDDAVARVEVKLDSGEWEAAAGTEFWSYYLKTAPVADGLHTVWVRGIDINGKVGDPAISYFHLDRFRPMHEVSSPLFGTLVSGQLVIKGTVSDANDVARTEFSADGGKTWTTTGIALDQATGKYGFQVQVDTKRMADGPAVYWFRSVDKVGSIGIMAFLFTVDNTMPTIEIVDPASTAVANGSFSVSCKVFDKVGVKRVSWSFGKESGEIELVPGNPYFAKRFDVSAIKEPFAEVRFEVEDIAGNVALRVLRQPMSQESDLPVVRILAPGPGSRQDGKILVFGSVADDDGVSSISWRLDGEGQRELPSTESFGFSMDLPASGKHTLYIAATDVNGLKGREAQVAFEAAGPAPEIRLLSAVDGGGERAFFPGLELSIIEGKASVSGAVAAPNGLTSLEFSINDSGYNPITVTKGGDGSSAFRIALPANLPYGLLRVGLRAKDAYGCEGLLGTFVYATNYSKIRAEPAVVFLDARIAEDGRVEIGEGKPLIGSFAGEAIAGVELVPPTPFASASFDGGLVRISYAKEGTSEPVKVRVTTTKAHVFETDRAFTIVADSSRPTLSLSSPAFGAWISGPIALEGRAEDQNGIAALEYSLDSATWTAMAAPGADGAFAATIEGPPEGPLAISVRATDRSGRKAMAHTAIIVDRKAPAPELLCPRPGDPLRGLTTFGWRLGEAPWRVARAEWSLDGSAFQPLSIEPVLSLRAALGPASTLVLRVVDRAGNAFEKDFAADLPREGIGAGEGAAAVGKAELKRVLDQGDTEGPRLSIVGKDALGDSVEYLAALTPSAEIAPDAKRVLAAGPVSIVGTLSGILLDPKKPDGAWGLSPLEIGSVLSIRTVSGKDGTSYSLSLVGLEKLKLSDGPVTIWFRFRDAGGADHFAALPMDIDVTKPLIEILEPSGAAGSSPGAFAIAGRVSDDRGIRSLTYEAGTEKGRVELDPADRYFVLRLSFPSKATSASVVLSAEDGTGYKASVTVKMAYDQKGDSPAASVLFPAKDADLEDPSPYYLYAEDDDGVARIAWTLDKSQPIATEGQGPLFIAEPASVEPGAHAFSFRAYDAQGLESAPATLAFHARRGVPEIAFEGFAVPKDSGSAYTPGMTLALAQGLAGKGRATFANPPASVEYSLNGAPYQKAALGKAEGASVPFDFPMPASLPYDIDQRVLFRLKATDAFGGAAEWLGYFYRVAPPQASPPDDGEGFQLVDGRVAEDGSLVLKPGDSIVSRFNGRPLASVETRPAVAAATVSFEGTRVSVSAAEEAVGARFKIVAITVDGDIFESRELSFTVDAEPPALETSSPRSGIWTRGAVLLEGSVADNNGIAALEYSMDEGASWSAIEPAPAAAGAARGAPLAFSKSFVLDGRPEGTAVVLLRAVDPAGRSVRTGFALNKDSIAPELTVVTPLAADTVNGTVSVTAKAADAGRIVSVEYTEDGETFGPLAFAPIGSRLPDPPPSKDAAPPVDMRPTTAFATLIDLSKLEAGLGLLAYRVRDAAGNELVYRLLDPAAPSFAVDSVIDKPIVQVQVPQELEVMRGDFVISGIAYDDDRVAEIFWRLDGGDWTRIDGDNKFSIPVRLAETTDNEHLFEAYAVDINGVRGETVSRTYRISKEEPIANLTAPLLEITNRGIIDLTGTASDANGIKEVWVSFDNGNTYDRAEGAESWTYRLDTRILKDAVYSIYVKIFDKYDTQGFYATLLTIDNTPPSLALDKPGDGQEFAGSFIAEGRASDTMVLERLFLEVVPLDGGPSIKVDLPRGGLYAQAIDLASLAPGWYDVRVTASDRANNTSYVARNIVVREKKAVDRAEIVFPVGGEVLSALFSVDGRIVSSARIAQAVLLVDGKPLRTVDLDPQGFFSAPFVPGDLEEGERVFEIRATAPDGTEIVSESRRVEYYAQGGWVSLKNFRNGQYVIGRPWLEGRAGWQLTEPDKVDKEAYDAYLRLQWQKRVRSVEISRDNGKTWEPASGGADFRFRFETQEYPNGELRLVMRATFEDGSTAIRKAILVVDTKPPQIDILQPSENGRFNERVLISGTASDMNGLGEISVIVRTGDKASYSVPGFIQGSFLDIHALGATRWEAAIGLSFFEDNVKLQVGLGQGFDVSPGWANLLGLVTGATGELESRFKGWVLSARLLANVAYLPFAYFFGPDWDFFSMSFGVGASFTYFSMNTSIADILSPPDSRYMVLSGVIAQWEFAKFSFDRTFFKSFAFYFEGGLVFIPSEGSTTLNEFIRPNIALGIRVGLF